MPKKHSTRCGTRADLSNYTTKESLCVSGTFSGTASSCSVTWNHATSASFPIHQGVREGAILSPLLYSIFVDKFLDLLTTSGVWVTIDTIYCGAQMYTDDLALVDDSPKELQAMLNIMRTYAGKWRYNLNVGMQDGLRRIPPLKSPCKIL